MTLEGSFQVWSGYQNWMPLTCVADSTERNTFSRSRMTNSEPVGPVLAALAVPRPVGPWAPIRDTLRFRTSPPSIG